MSSRVLDKASKELVLLVRPLFDGGRVAYQTLRLVFKENGLFVGKDLAKVLPILLSLG